MYCDTCKIQSVPNKMIKLTETRAGGNLLSALKVADNLCSVVTSLNQLEQYGLVRPTKNASAKARELKDDDLFARAHSLREAVQRRFDVSRRRRAVEYRSYIEKIIVNQRLGGVPPVTLYCPHFCEYLTDQTALVLPYRSVLVNVDGETQTEARFLLREELPESGDWNMSAEIYHGITEQHASQILHDFNRYAHPIKESMVAALNSEGNLTRVIENILQERGLRAEQFSRFGPTPNVKKGQLCTYRSLISAVVGAVGGFKGLQTPGKEIALLNNGGDGRMVEIAKPFIEHVLNLIDRDAKIGTNPSPVFGLFGAIYHEHQKLVNDQEWVIGAYTYQQTPGKGKAAVIKKWDAVLNQLGLIRSS